MRCQVCDILLDEDDNYCRRCGAAVQVSQAPTVRAAPQPPALFRSTAAPMATGTALVVGAAVLRWALRQALHALSEERPRAEPAPPTRALARREDAPPAFPGRQLLPAKRAKAETKQIVEIFWYRQTTRE